MKAKYAIAATLAAAGIMLGACAPAQPWASTTPSAEHRTVLTVGDSLLGGTDWALQDVLTQRGVNATVIDGHLNGTGLIGPVGSYPSALAWVQTLVAQHPEADTVLMEYGGACAYCNLWRADSVIYGSQAFYDRWSASAHSIIDWLHSQNKTVFWTVSPPAGPVAPGAASGATFNEGVAYVLSMLDHGYCAAAGTPCVDWWTPLIDTQGRYGEFLNYDGGNHRVRWPDKVHIFYDGAIRTSVWTAKVLGEWWLAHPLPVPPPAQTPPPDPIPAGDPVTVTPTATATP